MRLLKQLAPLAGKLGIVVSKSVALLWAELASFSGGDDFSVVVLPSIERIVWVVRPFPFHSSISGAILDTTPNWR